MSNTIRAKMQVQTVTQTTYSDKVELSCVYGGSTNAEDNTFSKATPSGGMTLQIDNPQVRGQLKPGQTFYVDLTPVASE